MYQTSPDCIYAYYACIRTVKIWLGPSLGLGPGLVCAKARALRCPSRTCRCEERHGGRRRWMPTRRAQLGTFHGREEVVGGSFKRDTPMLVLQIPSSGSPLSMLDYPNAVLLKSSRVSGGSPNWIVCRNGTPGVCALSGESN